VAPAAATVWPQGVFDEWKRVDPSVKANDRMMSVGEFSTMRKPKQLQDYSELAGCLKMEEAFEAFLRPRLVPEAHRPSTRRIVSEARASRRPAMISSEF
jgi:hypothetical protein